MKKNLIIICSLIFSSFGFVAYSQMYQQDNPLVHTYSIVAFDEETGEMGVAVQSHWFQVGTIVLWGEAGVGVVATQSLANPAFGPEGLKLMGSGLSSADALRQLIDSDQGRDVRQVALLDASGLPAVYTGNRCIEAAGHHLGQHYSVQANLMENDGVWPAMAEAFETTDGNLAERMISALKAAEAAGGDIRGKQSAALLVVGAENTGKPWVDRKIDLRVDDHESPIEELERLYQVHQAYRYMNEGDVAMEHGDIPSAKAAYEMASKLNPNNIEMRYWYAIALANSDNLDDALPIFKQVFNTNQKWAELTPRLIDNGLLKVDEKELERILDQ